MPSIGIQKSFFDHKNPMQLDGVEQFNFQLEAFLLRNTFMNQNHPLFYVVFGSSKGDIEYSVINFPSRREFAIQRNFLLQFIRNVAGFTIARAYAAKFEITCVRKSTAQQYRFHTFVTSSVESFTFIEELCSTRFPEKCVMRCLC